MHEASNALEGGGRGVDGCVGGSEESGGGVCIGCQLAMGQVEMPPSHWTTLGSSSEEPNLGV